MLVKLIILVLLLYLAFRAGRNLLQAALNDPKARRSRPIDRASRQGSNGQRRKTPWGDEEVEDVEWEDVE